MDYDVDFKTWCMDGHDPESYPFLDLVSEDIIDECMANILMDCI